MTAQKVTYDCPQETFFFLRGLPHDISAMRPSLYKRDILSLHKLFISQCLIPARNFCLKKKKEKKKSLANHICTGEDNSERNVIVSVEVVESFET